MIVSNRDDFTQAIKSKLAKRVAYICSNPSCQKLTIGPGSFNDINNIGVAAHIYAASPGGPRYNSNMAGKERVMKMVFGYVKVVLELLILMKKSTLHNY